MKGNGQDPDAPDGAAAQPAGAATEADPLASFGLNAGFVEELRGQHRVDPGSLGDGWSSLFERTEAPAPHAGEAPPQPARDGDELSPEAAEKHARAMRLIHMYRARGHRVADVDPLGGRPDYFPELDPAHYGFGDDDLGRHFIAGDLPGGPMQPLGQILERLRNTYCRRVAVEFTYMQDPGRKAWLQKRVEETENSTEYRRDERLRILEKVSAAELFENFLHTKFIGQKRFSLEGAESLIPILDAIVEGAGDHGMREIVLGMAHRGRLNVLSNILGKSYASIFSEFEDSPLLETPFGSGDVKYHKGFSSDRETRSGNRIHLSLTSNPSHLEAVDPVVEGRARAKQIRAGDERGRTVMPLTIHGECAFAGQGVVAETLNLDSLAGYSTGGSIHIVVNNQIGFTATPAESYSTLYPTDVAKMIQVPIFHVNGDDPEACVHVARIALEYRQRFGEDVVIDLVCYRRHGHNEGDEPRFTQPLLYDKIKKRESVRTLYVQHLLETGFLEEDDVKRIEQELRDRLTYALQSIKTKPPEPDEPYDPRGPWVGFSRTDTGEDPETGVGMERLSQVAEALGSTPAGFNVHPKLGDLMEKRRKTVAEGGAVDWGLAEALAFGTLLAEGTPVRLSGQDSTRGTFSHRHAVLVDQVSGTEFAPLSAVSPTQARFDAFDSPLSEVAVLGFEYGYSLADPSTLVLWEAQFGDFVNGAQVIIDQFITCAHVKWQRISGLVMLLPHGYEGQGPEHSSARPERFLQLCAEDNIQVVNCTTPAQYFHLLRRQMRREWRAPLVVLTPKSLLRAPRAVSRPSDLAIGRFHRVLDDVEVSARPETARRVLLCNGKVYYDILERLEARVEERKLARNEVAVVRVEQLYPWPAVELAQVAQAYENAEDVFWVQEEPSNMGAWTFVQARLEDILRPGQRLAYAGRRASAAPSGGSMRVHRERQAMLLDAALAGLF
ncbi:MAG: 2-oxoglutarate dehydrogenase E1 component [Deltaproteobacteria bacterium]|nr:2-oxoglutarate dehydrogenase E1 component [Deltaproteobacteria bacterium]MBW2448324.1 2-oxoglutarate dehydrogenase E1 component [Deltaproteobacteria bacterium]